MVLKDEVIDRPDPKKSIQAYSSPLIVLLEEARRNIDPFMCGVEIRGRVSRDRAWIEFVQDGRRVRLVLDVDWPEDEGSND